jgi:hypothetical protein
MKTFFNILQTIINQKHKNYPDEPFCEPETHLSEEQIYIGCLINNIYYEEKKNKHENKNKNTAHSKFISLNQNLNNSFYKKELKEKIFDIFSEAQKHYFSFSRLAHIYKIKKYPIVVSDDLMLNSLDINDKNTFILIDNKSKYLFNLNDLISIIETAIGNSCNFFSEPLAPNNPYNKQPFTDATLYNIYFKMKHSVRLISTLFHFFFLEEFNLNNFSEHYEPYIRENSIKKYVFNSHHVTLYTAVLVMLKRNPYTKLYNIHKDFPKETLVNIFRPFLFYYYIYNYDIKGTSKIYNYKQILHFKLKKFYEFNKSFGRKIIKIIRLFKKPVKKEYTFNTNHISFHKITINNLSSVHSDELLVNGINTTINLLINNNIFNVVNNAFDSDYDSSDDDDLDDDDDTLTDSHNNDISHLNQQLQTLNLENTNNGYDNNGYDNNGYDNNGYDEDIGTDDEQNDNGSIS